MAAHKPSYPVDDFEGGVLKTLDHLNKLVGGLNDHENRINKMEREDAFGEDFEGGHTVKLVFCGADGPARANFVIRGAVVPVAED